MRFVRRTAGVLGLGCLSTAMLVAGSTTWVSNAASIAGFHMQHAAPAHHVTVVPHVNPQALVPAQWSQTVATDEYSCAISGGSAPGTLWCWGDDTFGQLGQGNDGIQNDISTPSEVGSASDWIAVTANTDHTCGTRAGTLYCWGNNANGQLGIGSTTEQDSPALVPTGTWGSIATGAAHSCGIRTDGAEAGTLWCWGYNADGQLGTGDLVQRTSPTEVAGDLNTWVTVTAGGNHTCATQTDGSLWCWGENDNGELGIGSFQNANAPVEVSAGPWAQVSAGSTHTCGVTTSGHLFCWGDDGIHPRVNTSTEITQPARSTWTAVSAGDDGTCASEEDTNGPMLWCWGLNDHGALGQGNNNPLQKVVAVPGSHGWLLGSVGGEHTCVTRIDNQSLWCWGQGSVGELGTRGRTDRFQPTPVGPISPWVTETDSGGGQTCGITALHTLLDDLFCWGLNKHGQVGNGTTKNVGLPTQIGTSTWGEVSGGEAFTCGVQASPSSQSVWCWGANSHGQLGLGDTRQRLSPTKIGGNAHWASSATIRDLSLGDDHACAIQTDGTLWCWGHNANGELGNGTTTDSNVPVQVGTATDWIWAGAGATHSCGIQNKGTLWCWGDNAHGELGDGTTTQQLTPEQVGIGTKWSSVDLGRDYSCAISSTAPGLAGQISCWGRNDDGQLGIGTTGRDVKRPTPVAGGVGSWIDVSASLDHTCAISSADALYCWGHERDGDLGDGQVTGIVSTPAQVIYQKGDPWLEVTATDDRTCAVKSFMLCFGDDSHGQLGDGSPVPFRQMPAPVIIVPN